MRYVDLGCVCARAVIAGSIYGFGLVGCVGMYLVLNLMAAGRSIDAASVFSIFGYGLLPVTVLASLSVVLPLSGTVGLVLAPVYTCTIISASACDSPACTQPYGALARCA